MKRVLLFVALVGCSSPPPPPPATTISVRVKAPPPPPPPEPPKSPFHVVGWSEHVSDKTANPTELCTIDGAVFVCGTDHVVRLEGDELITDEALEAGLLRDEKGALHGKIHALLGHFPDDPWLVMKSGLNVGTEALYRRTPKEWVLAKKWKIESVTGNVQHLLWKPGKVAVLASSLKGDERAAVEIVSKSGATPMPAIPNGAGCPQWLKYPSLSIAKDGSLVVSGTRCDADAPAWLRLVPGKLAEKHDGEPEYPPAPPSDYVIVSSALQRKQADGSLEDVTMPAPPVADASTLVPFQVIVRSKDDVVVAARFRSKKVTGVAILRTIPAKTPLKL